MGYSEDDVRLKAYELWRSRGRTHGHDQDDWYAAELLLESEHALRCTMRLPEFRRVDPAEILRQVQISHAGIQDFFTPLHSWIETAVDLETVLDFDRNRKLHFDEGFLNASYRVALDLSITAIADSSHFPYRDLQAVRSKIAQFAAMYKSGAHLPPPLFFYPAPCQLEVLDGVHRSVAAFQVLRNCRPAAFTIWLGFNHQVFDAGVVVQQLWSHSMRRSRQAAASGR